MFPFLKGAVWSIRRLTVGVKSVGVGVEDSAGAAEGD
jgi:hypothetical protein